MKKKWGRAVHPTLKGAGGKQIPWARQAQQEFQDKCDRTWLQEAATDKEFACAWTTPARRLNFEFCFGDAPLTSPTNPHLPTLMLHGGSIRVKLALCNFGFARCCRCNAEPSRTVRRTILRRTCADRIATETQLDRPARAVQEQRKKKRTPAQFVVRPPF